MDNGCIQQNVCKLVYKALLGDIKDLSDWGYDFVHRSEAPVVLIPVPLKCGDPVPPKQKPVKVFCWN